MRKEVQIWNLKSHSAALRSYYNAWPAEMRSVALAHRPVNDLAVIMVTVWDEAVQA